MKNVEDIYTLSPMQQGILFNSLYAPESEAYFQQQCCTLHGNLNSLAFKQAWQQAIARHPILRTAFVWDGLDEPHQVVCKSVNLPWVESDWQSLTPTEQQQQLEALLQSDRAKGFQLNQAPIMRCTLIQIAPETFHFVWSHHHLLLDGWCYAIVFKEIFSFYDSFCKGNDLYLETPRPYRDYIAWLQQQDQNQAQVFWHQALKGFTAPTPLVIDKAGSKGTNQQPTSYDQQHLCLSVAQTVMLQSFAQQHRLTLNILIQGVWALLLCRYSQESDVVFGATVSGRPPVLGGVESIVGLFINTLPVRVQVSPSAKLLPWLRELQTRQVEQLQYSYTQLVEIQGVSDVPRGMSLFESIVVFENYPVDASLQQLDSSLAISNFRAFDQTNYPLTVVAEPGSEFSVRIGYDTNRFESKTIQRMLGHFQTLLLGMVANPQASLCELPLLKPQERQQLLLEWNNTDVRYPQNQYIHQLFESFVEQTPDAVAVAFADQHLTYQQLNDRANQLAHYLQSLGVGPEVLVALCMERSIEMMVGLLGILKAGGAYVPLDPELPQERLALMLEDTGTSVLLTQSRLVSSLPAHQGRLICLDTDWEVISQESRENPVSGVEPDNLIYVIYTSGSTGKPKGVMNTHRGVCNRLVWMQETYQLTSQDRVLQKTPYSFDVSVWELFWPLFTGACLVLAKPLGHKESAYLVKLIQEQQITTLHFVPSMLQVFLEEPGIDACSCLKRVFCSGEALTLKLQERFFGRFHCQLHNLYGPTEAAIDVSFWQCQPESVSLIVPLGYPISNLKLYILDKYLQPVPIGIPGELHIQGVGLARGYLTRPDLTAQKFIPDPFSNQPGSRLYQTGDQARYLADGSIEYLGRIDHQVKLRGFRLELGEIEAVLRQHPQIRETVVLLREDQPGNKRLVGYVVSNTESIDTSVVRRFLSEKLPDYMVPSAFVQMEVLPLTPNGKCDRRALPAPDPSPNLATSFVLPRTPTEKILAPIWAEVLNLEKVGIYDNLFELGGHSLLATQLISRIRETFSLDVALRDLFDYPTVAELAGVIEKLQEQHIELQIPTIVPLSRETRRLKRSLLMEEGR